MGRGSFGYFGLPGLGQWHTASRLILVITQRTVVELDNCRRIRAKPRIHMVHLHTIILKLFRHCIMCLLEYYHTVHVIDCGDNANTNFRATTAIPLLTFEQGGLLLELCINTGAESDTIIL